MTRLLLLCLCVAFALCQPLVQVYPDGRNFDTEFRESAFPTTTDRIKLTLEDLPALATDSVNSLSVSLRLPANSLFEIGFSFKDDALQRQAAWRIERVGTSTPQVSVCMVPDDGVAEPACTLNGGPVPVTQFNTGFNDILVEVEFLDETTIQSTLQWNGGQTFQTTFYQFAATNTFTLNMETGNVNDPIRLRDIFVGISNRLYIELGNCPSEEEVAAIYAERFGSGLAVAYTESPECDITARFYGTLDATTSEPFYRCNGREQNSATESPTSYFDVALEGGGRYFMETCGNETTVDTRIRVYGVPCSQLDGTNLGEGVCLSNNDDRCANGGSLVQVNLEDETGVQDICVGVTGVDGGEGNFQLTVANRDSATRLLRETGTLETGDTVVPFGITDCGGVDLTYLDGNLVDTFPLILAPGVSYDYYLATTCRDGTNFNTTLILFDTPCENVDANDDSLCVHANDDYGCKSRFEGASSFFFELDIDEQSPDPREVCFVVTDSDPDVSGTKNYELVVTGFTISATIPVSE